MRSRERRFSLIMLSAILGLMACQPTIEAKPAATAIMVASVTASQISSPTASPSAISTTIPATATASLIPYSLVIEATPINLLRINKLKPAKNIAPLALAPFDHFYFSYPLPQIGLKRNTPSSRYGKDQKPETSAGHTGMDIGVNSGTPVLAAGPGEVIFSGYGLLSGYDNPEDDYGIAVVIQHNFGYEGEPLYTVYAHLSVSMVEIGQSVESGEQIGRSGNTGFSSGPHLHFEVRLGRNEITYSRNPELWISPPQGWGILVGEISNSYGTRLKEKSIRITALDSGRITWATTYSTEINVESDNYYDENFVLGDLPAGRYEVAVPYVIGTLVSEVVIQAGAISYFSFRGLDSFQNDWPEIDLPPNLPITP